MFIRVCKYKCSFKWLFIYSTKRYHLSLFFLKKMGQNNFISTAIQFAFVSVFLSVTNFAKFRSLFGAYEQECIFIVPYLLWHSVFLVSSEGQPFTYSQNSPKYPNSRLFALNFFMIFMLGCLAQTSHYCFSLYLCWEKTLLEI